MRRSGQSMVLVALFLVFLLGIAALGLTYGSVAYARTQLQNAVDAAALAGAQTAAAGQSPTLNQSWLKSKNLGSRGHLTVRFSQSVADGVRATASTTVAGGFASLFGDRSFTVSATAVATYSAGPPFDYALFQGSQNPPALTANGSLNIQGSAHSNGGMMIDGSYCVTQGITTVTGTTRHGSAGCATAVTQTSVIPLPVWTLAQVTPPGAPTETVSGTPSGPITGPIILNGQGQDINFNGSEALTGPILIVNAPAVTFDGSVSLTGSLVVDGGNLTFNGSVSQSGPGTAGMSIAVLGQGDNIIMDGSSSLEGIFYDPQGSVDFNGSATITGAVIANRVENLNGSASITYDAQLTNAVPVKTIQLVQ